MPHPIIVAPVGHHIACELTAGTQATPRRRFQGACRLSALEDRLERLPEPAAVGDSGHAASGVNQNGRDRRWQSGLSSFCNGGDAP